MTEPINSIAADYFAELLDAEPTWAHLLGDQGPAGLFEDATKAAESAHVEALRAIADRARAIPASGLGAQDATTRDVLLFDAETRTAFLEAGFVESAADPVSGPQATLPIVLGMLAVPDPAGVDAMVDKLTGIGRYYGELAERQRDGVARGWVAPEFAVTGTIEQIEASLASDPVEDPLVTAVQLPGDVDAAEVRSRLAAAVRHAVRPGLTAYRDVLRDEVLPHARPDERVGLSWLPGGDSAYARTLRYYTTTDLTAQEIHDLGLAQVESLAREYRELGPAVVGSDDLDTILHALRTDRALHFTDAETILQASKEALAKAEAALPEWFAVLPKAPCAVSGTPTGPKAFYFPPSADGARGGTFFVNVSNPASWGTFEIESMAFHEGVPGHHLQLAIASELQDVPDLRRHVDNAGYAEGWGLYTERLAEEMGLYSTDVDRMGMLSADSMRACRLVVDTGLHALGWSRQQAVDYMVANSPMTDAAVRAEVDRYITSPGQAASYMVGRLEILRMRAEAQARQGAAYDIKTFHSAVLDSGALPLTVLDRVVRARMP